MSAGRGPAPEGPLRVWFDHQRAARALQALLEVTEPEGIPLLPVKGALLARTLYADVTERPITDLDLRVRRADLQGTGEHWDPPWSNELKPCAQTGRPVPPAAPTGRAGPA